MLAPGGVFYLSTPYADLRSRVADPAWWLIRHRHYSQDRLRLLATTAGFTVEQLFAKGGWWQVAAMTNLYVAKWIFRRPPFFADKVNRRMDSEWSGSSVGFTNLFFRGRKA